MAKPRNPRLEEIYRRDAELRRALDVGIAGLEHVPAPAPRVIRGPHGRRDPEARSILNGCAPDCPLCAIERPLYAELRQLAAQRRQALIQSAAQRELASRPRKELTVAAYRAHAAVAKNAKDLKRRCGFKSYGGLRRYELRHGITRKLCN